MNMFLVLPDISKKGTNFKVSSLLSDSIGFNERIYNRDILCIFCFYLYSSCANIVGIYKEPFLTEAFLDPSIFFQHKCHKSYKSTIIFYEHSRTIQVYSEIT